MPLNTVIIYDIHSLSNSVTLLMSTNIAKTFKWQICHLYIVVCHLWWLCCILYCQQIFHSQASLSRPGCVLTLCTVNNRGGSQTHTYTHTHACMRAHTLRSLLLEKNQYPNTDYSLTYMSYSHDFTYLCSTVLFILILISCINHIWIILCYC